MKTTRRNFLKTIGLAAAAPMTVAEIIAKASSQVQEIEPTKLLLHYDPSESVKVRFVGRQTVREELPKPNWRRLNEGYDSNPSSGTYRADVYHLSREVKGKLFERYVFLDAEIGDAFSASRHKEYIPWELQPHIDVLLGVK